MLFNKIGSTKEGYCEANMAKLTHPGGYNITNDIIDDRTNVAISDSTAVEVYNISSANLSTTTTVEILMTLRDINSLIAFKINNNFIDDTAVHSIVNIISHNHLLEELDISCNKFTVSGVIQMAQALSKSKYINILDISKSFRDYDSYEKANDLVIA